MNKENKLFTLVEFIVVISVLLILLSLISPSLNSIYRVANDNQCKNNLRVIGHSSFLYINDHDETLMGPTWPGHHPRIRSYLGRYYKLFPYYLEPYMKDDTKTAPNGTTYNRTFICPTNQSLALQGNQESFQRVSYRETIDQMGGHPLFGRPGNDRSGPMLPPRSMNDILDTTKTEILVDADNLNAAWLKRSGQDVSDYPVHQAAFRNTLFFDTSVRSIDWFPE